MTFEGHITWVSDQTFDTPIIQAIQSSTGNSMRVDIIPDVPKPNESMEYLRNELERQIEATMYDDDPPVDTNGSEKWGVDNEKTDSEHDNYKWSKEKSPKRDQILQMKQPPVVGALLSGQLYAMPFATRGDGAQIHGLHSKSSHGLSAVHRRSQASSTSSASLNAHHGLSTNVPLIAGRFPGQPHDGKQQAFGLTNPLCGLSTPALPGCLFKGADLQRPYDSVPGSGTSLATMEKPIRHDTTLQQNMGALNYHPEFGYLPADVGNQKQEQRQQRQRKQRKLLRILGSWLPPTIALIFVVSFELGRRKRQKDSLDGVNGVDYNDLLRVADDKGFSVVDSSPNPREVIQVTDQVLGYGGHGTVVFRGTLEGRNVAVKRMLKTYLASADREISLLIESDGHPNVVRYFLKEVRGDFVYLALELCDISLQNLIGTLCNVPDDSTSKVGSSVLDRSVLPAAKEIVHQIATGVCHLHSLRIVHR